MGREGVLDLSTTPNDLVVEAILEYLNREERTD